MDGWKPDPEVAKGYGVHLRTLDRWDHQPELNFPPPQYLNGRKYRNIEALRQWDIWRAAGGGGKATRKPTRPPRAAAVDPSRGINPERT
jgi:hypothetical protein